jgi:hypothetical protein
LRFLTGAGLLFIALAATVAATGGFQTSCVSVTSPSRLVLEGSVLLPEVFVERVTHVDGAAASPVAMAEGAKALIGCDAPGGYCYMNGGSDSPAPPQPGFTR